MVTYSTLNTDRLLGYSPAVIFEGATAGPTDEYAGLMGLFPELPHEQCPYCAGNLVVSRPHSGKLRLELSCLQGAHYIADWRPGMKRWRMAPPPVKHRAPFGTEPAAEIEWREEDPNLFGLDMDAAEWNSRVEAQLAELSALDAMSALDKAQDGRKAGNEYTEPSKGVEEAARERLRGIAGD